MSNTLGQSKTENFGSLDQLVEQVEQWSIDKENSDFKLIPDYPNYVISKSGDIIILSYKDKKNGYRKIRVKKTGINWDGYETVPLVNEKGTKTFLVHRLVAQAFIPNPENKETVNHIDGDKTNNNIDNLEWSTRGEQMIHAYDTGLKKYNNIMTTSSNIKQCKPVKVYVKEIKETIYFLSARDCSRHFGFSDRWCDKMINEMSGDTKKYLFKYVSIDEVKNNTDKVTLSTLIKLIEYWSFEKGLHKNNSFVQFAKQVEEMGEVAAALCRNDIDALRDGIGDVIVTLVILAQQNNMTLQECLEQAYGEIKDRKGVMSKDGSFIKEADLEG